MRKRKGRDVRRRGGEKNAHDSTHPDPTPEGGKEERQEKRSHAKKEGGGGAGGWGRGRRTPEPERGGLVCVAIRKEERKKEGEERKRGEGDSSRKRGGKRKPLVCRPIQKAAGQGGSWGEGGSPGPRLGLRAGIQGEDWRGPPGAKAGQAPFSAGDGGPGGVRVPRP